MGTVAGSLRNAQLVEYRLQDTVEVAPVNRLEQGMARFHPTTNARPEGVSRAQLGGLSGLKAVETGSAKDTSGGKIFAPGKLRYQEIFPGIGADAIQSLLNLRGKGVQGIRGIGSNQL